MAYTALVPHDAGPPDRTSSVYPSTFEEPGTQGDACRGSSTPQEVDTFSGAFVWSTLQDSGLSQKSTELLTHAWREGTRNQYNTAVRRWREFCCKGEIDPFAPTITHVVNFLTSLYEMGLGYSGVASARSALGNFIHIPGCSKLAEHPLIQGLLKGIGNVRPPQPRYTMIWDSSTLIRYLATLANDDLDFQGICHKTAALLTILSGQRVSTIQKFTVSHLELSDELAVFNMVGYLKQSKPSRKPQPVIFHRYPHNQRLCPVLLVKCYLQRRAHLPVVAPCDDFFLTHRKPHHPASKDTLARWVKDVLKQCGVDTDTYKPHSYCSASSSHAKSAGVSLEAILRSGQWASTECFVKFYDKAIDREDLTVNRPFATSILEDGT